MIATFSENTARSVVRDYGVDSARVQVVGAGANVFPDVAHRRDDGRTVTFVGYDFARKGGPVLLEAFRILRRRIPKARLLVAGSAPPTHAPERVFFLGPVDLGELAGLMSRPPCSPCRRSTSPSGSRSSTPWPAGSRASAPAPSGPGVVREGETGLLVPPGDPVSLAAALERLLSDPALARAMGARGRARVFAGARWSHVAERLERTLVRAFSSRGRAA